MLFSLCGLSAGSQIDLRIKTTGQCHCLTTARRVRLIPYQTHICLWHSASCQVFRKGHSHSIFTHVMVLGSQSDLKAIHRRPPWATFILFTPGFCSQWPQTNLATDLPGTGWLKCDHTSGSPVFFMQVREPDLLFSSSYPPEIQRILSSSFSLTQRQAGIWCPMV